MDRLEDAEAVALAVRQAGQRRRRQQAERAGNDRRLVRQDVAEQVGAEEDAVELGRSADDEHAGAVDEVVVEGQLRELLGVQVADDRPPEPRRRQDVGLVDRVDG